MKMTATKFLTLPLLLSIAPQARAQDVRSEEIRAQLEAFDSDPVRAMDEIPLKHDDSGNLVHRSRFNDDEISSKSYIDAKDALRSQLSFVTRDGLAVKLSQVREGRSSFSMNDRVQDLVDMPGGKLVTTLESIEASKLTNSKLPETPWSDTYWPIYQGEIAARYADSSFMNPSVDKWQSYFDYSHAPSKDFNSVFSALTLAHKPSYATDMLSPAEKYDLLVGDANGTLTHKMWKDGREYADDNGGTVETWMGLCHGWAPASIQELRPKKAVTVLGADGKTKITFYPSDIKALATTLWANGNVTSKLIGGRCNTKDPTKDASGRVQDEDCFDTNPGTWHLAIVNQIGVARRSFIIDATFDYEVWNQPVYGYTYSYFNPQTRKPVKTLAEAKIARSAFTKDKFAAHRSKKGTSIVGIAMDMTYVVETDASHATTDAPANDQTTTVRYMYDLELDAQGNIVGGEWYSNLHPDFLWVNAPGARATTLGDRVAIGNWNLSAGLPIVWKAAAAKNSRAGLPLEKIVRSLINASRL